MYFDLLPFAKECGVKIATENMWGWDTEKDQSSFAACATSASFNEHLDVVNDDFFVACLVSDMQKCVVPEKVQPT